MFEVWRSLSPFTESSDYVFSTLTRVDKANPKFARMNKEFNRLIQDLGLFLDDQGDKLSAYSMRHTGITKMIKRGVPISVIAKSGNTSGEQIARHYSHLLDRDVIGPIAEADRKYYERREARRKNQLSEQVTILRHLQQED